MFHKEEILFIFNNRLHLKAARVVPYKFVQELFGKGDSRGGRLHIKGDEIHKAKNVGVHAIARGLEVHPKVPLLESPNQGQGGLSVVGVEGIPPREGDPGDGPSAQGFHPPEDGLHFPGTGRLEGPGFLAVAVNTPDGTALKAHKDAGPAHKDALSLRGHIDGVDQGLHFLKV